MANRRESGYEDFALGGFLGATVVVAALVGADYWASEREVEATAWVNHTHEARASIARARADLLQAQAAQGGYVLAGRPEDLELYEGSAAALEGELGHLRNLITDNPSQRSRLDEVERDVRVRMARSREVVNARRTQGLEAAQRMIASGASGDSGVDPQALLATMDAEEQRLLRTRTREESKTLAWVRIVTATVAGLLLVALAVLYRMDRRRRVAYDAMLRSERRFHQMTQSIRDYAILMLDPEGRVASWNAGAEIIKGWREDEIVGQHFSRFYPPEVDRATIDAGLEAAATEGRFEEEGWRVRKDGSRFWAGVLITSLRNEAGALQGYVKVTRDLTERRRVDEALTEINRSLAATVSERTEDLRGAVAELQEAKLRLEDLSSRLIAAQEE
ncbi:MAG TPA: CHASE3 domain-containing protein, partial [Usitatibacter sp.]|nr:CHASE3 domain-containing protein [Usitatibacter sp.]